MQFPRYEFVIPLPETGPPPPARGRPGARPGVRPRTRPRVHRRVHRLIGSPALRRAGRLDVQEYLRLEFTVEDPR